MTKSSSDVGRRERSVIRCAVYTRKSSEEGLEQDFNSLHAQRDACEAYVRSQKHEGWVVLSTAFDDGGLSGGTMERPALQRLLAEIRAGKLDTVVVYKVDRLTRSLADFAKIVEIFDAHGVAFVSVTQHFNTTTSMGRLTLNVLLSFAQFEREVAGERIRDKIAASKQRGMWMGGSPPLGYDVRDRKLVVNEKEAEQVRQIFSQYVQLRSVRLLREELMVGGVLSKRLIAASGRERGGQVFSRGALYGLLQNRIYLGEISHKGLHYPGLHEAILDRELWDQAQSVLTANAGERRAGHRAMDPSLLAGLLFDAAGQRMTPTHAVKAGKRYRYYISRQLVTGPRSDVPEAFRFPAAEVEQAVCDRLRAWLADAAAVLEAAASDAFDVEQRRTLIGQAEALAHSWPEFPRSRQREIICSLVRRIDLREESVTLKVLSDRLEAVLRGAQGGTTDPGADDGPARSSLVLSISTRLQRIEKTGRLLVETGASGRAQLNAPLVKMLVRAHELQRRLLQGQSVEDLARDAGLSVRQARWILRLAWLAPDITQAILRGEQPRGLTADRLARMVRLPVEWQAQRSALSFPELS